MQYVECSLRKNNWFKYTFTFSWQIKCVVCCVVETYTCQLRLKSMPDDELVPMQPGSGESHVLLVLNLFTYIFFNYNHIFILDIALPLFINARKMSFFLWWKWIWGHFCDLLVKSMLLCESLFLKRTKGKLYNNSSIWNFIFSR